MTVDRHELHELVDELPEEQVALVLADVRRRLPQAGGDNTWPPAFFGIIEGDELPSDAARNPDRYLAAYGFGHDSL